MEITTLGIFVGIIICTLIAATLQYIARSKEHNRRRKQYINYFREVFKDNNTIMNFCIAYADRQFDYIINYFLFQEVGRISEGFGLIFSIITLTTVSTQTETSNISIIISICAITFVVISVYVNPIKRAKQYLKMWRCCDRNIMQILSMDPDKKTIAFENNEIDVGTFIRRCASDLSDGEEAITTDEE